MKALTLRGLVVALALVVPVSAHAQSRDFADVMGATLDRSMGGPLLWAAQTDGRNAAYDKMSAADLKREMAYMWQNLEAIKPADLDRYGSRKGDVGRVVTEQKDMLRAAFHDKDSEAGKKAFLEFQKNVARQYKVLAVKEGLTRDVPNTERVADAVFGGTTIDELKKPSSSFRTDDVEGRAMSASIAVGQAKALLDIAKNDPKVFADGASAARQDPDRAKTGLETVVKTNETRLAAMKESWDGRKKEIANAPKYTGPSIGLPSRPVMGQRYLSPNAMIAEKGLIPGAGVADGIGKRIGAAAFTGPLKAIDTGFRAGAFYENSALTNFQIAEGRRRQSEYEAKVKDWDKNVRPQVEANERQKAIDDANWRWRQMGIESMLNGGGLPPVITIGDKSFSTTPGFNGGRFAETRPGVPGYGSLYGGSSFGGGTTR